QNPVRGDLPGRSAAEAMLPAADMRDMHFIWRPLERSPGTRSGIRQNSAEGKPEFWRIPLRIVKRSNRLQIIAAWPQAAALVSEARPLARMPNLRDHTTHARCPLARRAYLSSARWKLSRGVRGQVTCVGENG